MNQILKKTLFCMLGVGFCATQAHAQLSTNPDKFLGNITTGYQIDYGNEKFYQLWNQITAENESKWDQVEGSRRGSFNWTNNDRIYKYAKEHNFPFKWHTLIWGGQYPSWMNSLSSEEQLKAIEEWMDAIKNRYPDLPMIDVVNEALSGHNPAPYKNALGGDGLTGYDWIIKAFEMAHERWPDAILIYNDYNTFQWDTDRYIDLVRTIRDAGAPIDAYGCQSHDMLNREGTAVLALSSFQTSMEKLHDALMMPMYSTEYDVGTSNDNLQLKAYQEQIKYMWEQDYCAGITLWGYIYGSTWTTDGNSGLIKNGKDRLAMTWLREYMASDDAKNAKSPFPGMKKEASVYVKPASIKVTQNDVVPIEIRASLRTKTIDHIDFYIDDQLYTTLSAEPYRLEYTPTEQKKYNLKAVVTATDGTTFERLSSITAYEPRSTFNGEIAELPGTLEAENFDTGADGIAYHDSNNSKEGDAASYRPDGGIDVVKGNGGHVIGYTNNGEWMEYTVNVKEAGFYEYDAVVSSGTSNSGFSVSVINNGEVKSLIPALVVPQTGNNDWGKYVTMHGRTTIPLEAGQQVIRLSITGSSCNIDKIVFNHIDVDQNIQVNVSSDPTPAIIKEDVTIKVDATSPNGDIKEVKAYLDNVLLKDITEAPFEFVYTPKEKGTYKFTFEAIDAQNKVSELVPFSMKANNRRAAYKGTIEIPGIIEAEDFDKGGEGFTFHDSDSNDEGDAKYRSDNEGVDIVTGNGGKAIGYTAVDEWLEYSVDVKEAGEYEYEAVASSGSSNSSFTLSLVEGETITQLCKVNVARTADNSWSTYKTFTGKLSKNLEKGPQILRITITGAYCNIDKIELKCTSTTGIEDLILESPAHQDSYDLFGRKVNGNYKGIIIKNGKKHINK